MVGFLSDAFGAAADLNGLRKALLVAMGGFAWSILHYLLASRTLIADTVD